MSGAPDIIHPAQAQAGDTLPAISLPLTFELVALTPFATWDFFPGHHNPTFAQAQGLPDIYLNTIALQGFADRLVTDWTQEQCVIVRRKMAMRKSAYPGDTLHISGTIADVSRTADGTLQMQVAIQLDTERGRVCEVTTTIHLPKHYEGNIDE